MVYITEAEISGGVGYGDDIFNVEGADFSEEHDPFNYLAPRNETMQSGSQSDLQSDSQSGSQKQMYSGMQSGSQKQMQKQMQSGSQSSSHSGMYSGSQSDLYSGIHIPEQFFRLDYIILFLAFAIMIVTILQLNSSNNKLLKVIKSIRS